MQVAAEREWLQDADVPPPPNPPPDVATPTTRVDWRLRATSRVKARKKVDTTAVGEASRDSRNRRNTRRTQPPLAQVQPGEPFYEKIQAYQERFLGLLAAEQAEDEAVLKERLSSWTVDRLKEEGYCLTGLSAFWLEANQFGRPVASLLIGPGIVLPDHRFENGTQVLLSRIDPLQEKPFQGSIVARTSTQLRVSFQETFDLDGTEWRLDLGHSNIVYERMRTAVSHLSQDPLSLSQQPSLILQGTHLRPILLAAFSPSSASSTSSHALQASDDKEYLPHETLEHASRLTTEHRGVFRDDMRIQSWARRYAMMNPVRVEGDPILPLNPTQIRAIAMMIGETISLVQGPPGTGKTKTIIEAVRLLKVHFEVPHPILVCTYTNVAVDNLVEGLAASGVKPLRVGYGGKVKQSLYEHTLDHKLTVHHLKPQVDKLSQDEERIQKRVISLSEKLKELTLKDGVTPNLTERKLRMQKEIVWTEKRLGIARAKMYALHQEMLKEVIENADVICTTCITSACVALNVIDFPVVFLDEASMSTEPASLIPIMKGSQHIVLIGDHKQLPPVITSREAQANGLGISLFERLTEEGAVPSMMLDVQYRMHPAISRFPAEEFYNFSLQNGTVDPVGNISSRLLPPISSHLEVNSATGNRPSVVFLDHAGSESIRDRSRVNKNEANIVCSVVEDLLLNNEKLRGEDIGIIAPYAAQISLLNRLFNVDPKYRARFKSVLGDRRAMQLANIEIKTVDGFEGREKEIVIFSTVRNNPSGYIGFLADRRRLNVGLTRAKRGLFVVGSISTLKAGKMSGISSSEQGGHAIIRVGRGAEAWRRYAQFLSDQGLVIQLSGEKLQRALYGNSAPNLTL